MNTAEDGLPTPQRYWAILTLMIGVALSCLDTAIVNIALPTIARDLKVDAADSIGVVNTYQLAVMISLLPFASFGDIFGYRRVYRFGLVLYTGATLISALSGSLTMLILGRALQGLGAAGLMSVNTALVRHAYPRRQIGRGIALTSLVVATSSAAGPTIAAAILAVAPWPFLFAVNVPIGLATAALALRWLPYTPPSGHRFDLASAVLCALMFGSLISGINGIGHRQAALLVLGELSLALASGMLLVRRQLSQEMPLLPVDLFRRPVFSLSVTTSVCCFVAQGIAFVALPFYLQDALGISAVKTGLMMTPWAVTTALLAPIAGRLADRYPAGILGSIGLCIVGAGFVLLVLLPAHPEAGDILWRGALCGGGMGIFQQPNNRAIVLSAPRERSGGAGAIQGMSRLLGQSIGSALVALVFGLGAGGPSARIALMLAAGFAAAGVVTSLSRMFEFVRSPSEAEPPHARPANLRGPAS